MCAVRKEKLLLCARARVCVCVCMYLGVRTPCSSVCVCVCLCVCVCVCVCVCHHVGVEDALTQMCKGERALFIVPATLMQQPSPACALPAPPSHSVQIEVTLHLISIVQVRSTTHTGTQPGPELSITPGQDKRHGNVRAWPAASKGFLAVCSVAPFNAGLPPTRSMCVCVCVCVSQVRDMTGTGEVTKRRVKEGQGEFPIDCPLHDTTVRIHYRVRYAYTRRPRTHAHTNAHDLRTCIRSCVRLGANTHVLAVHCATYRAVKDGVRGPWLYDTRTRTTQDSSTQEASESATQLPVEIDTGEICSHTYRHTHTHTHIYIYIHTQALSWTYTQAHSMHMPQSASALAVCECRRREDCGMT